MTSHKKTIIASTCLVSIALVAIGACKPRTFNNDRGEEAEFYDFQKENIMGRFKIKDGKPIGTAIGLQPNEVVLTFDDGPGPRTEELVDFLIQQGAPATFFMTGKDASSRPAVVQKIANATVGGAKFSLGNHTWSHPNLNTLNNPDLVQQQILDADGPIAKYAKGNLFFRAPYGALPFSYVDKLNKTSLVKYIGPVYWDIGGQLTDKYAADWACWKQNVAVNDCAKRYLNETKAKQGGILLAHDVHSKTIDMMKIVVPELKRQGFKIVSIEAHADAIAKLGGTANPPSAHIAIKGVAKAIRGTQLKKEMKDPSVLPPTAVCDLAAGKAIGFRSIEDIGNGQVSINVDIPSSGCPDAFWRDTNIFIDESHFTILPRECKINSRSDGTANIRSSANSSSSSNIVGKMKNGEVIKPEASEPGGWYRITYNGTASYISRVVLEDACKSFPYSL